VRCNRGIEIRVLDAVAVDLANIKVGGYLCDVLGWDAIGGAVDGEGREIGLSGIRLVSVLIDVEERRQLCTWLVSFS